jgi:integrase
MWFHDLRRSFVTNARRFGVPESVVMRMSGHKTRAVFDRYNIVSVDDLRQAVDRIERKRARQVLWAVVTFWTLSRKWDSETTKAPWDSRGPAKTCG